MKHIVLDTSILLHLIRESNFSVIILQHLDLYSDAILRTVPVVVYAELLSLAKRHNWGERKMINMEKRIKSCLEYNITYSDTELLNAYVKIDNISRETGITMSKNDLWIAATAVVLDAELITTDKDFAHLAPLYLDLEPV